MAGLRNKISKPGWVWKGRKEKTLTCKHKCVCGFGECD